MNGKKQVDKDYSFMAEGDNVKGKVKNATKHCLL